MWRTPCLTEELHHKELNITEFKNKDDNRFHSLKYPQELTHKICEPKTAGSHLPVYPIWYSNWEVYRGYCQSSVSYAQLACKWNKCHQTGSINQQREQECTYFFKTKNAHGTGSKKISFAKVLFFLLQLISASAPGSWIFMTMTYIC